MPCLIALDWDASEIRVAVAQSHVGHVVLEHAFAVSLGAERSGQTWDANDVGMRLGRELDARGIGRSAALVSVGRDAVELKILKLPPAPDNELASLVRFQAQREFHALTDDWSLDYLRLAGNDNESFQLLAAAAGPDVVQRITSATRAAGLNLRRVVLRPCCVASLVLRCQGAVDHRALMVVDALAERAELTVVADRKVALMRSVRLPESDAAQEPGAPATGSVRNGVLEMELRRTIAAGQEELGGERLAAIYVCTGADHNVGLAQRLCERLSLPAHPVDPLTMITLSSHVKHAPPAHAAHYAPLVGLLLDEAENVPPAIDFLRPRNQARGTNRRTMWGLLAAASLLLIACALGLNWKKWSELDRQIAFTAQQSADIEGLLTRSQAVHDRVVQLEQWLATDIVWLDELHRISQRFPQPQDAMLDELHMVVAADSGVVTLKGRTRDHQVIDSLEQALRDAKHAIHPQSSHQDPSGQPYQWQFESTMSVKP